MKSLTLKSLGLILFVGLFISACSSVKVASDYDDSVDLSTYKTYAFYKPGIDLLKMSDIDKKRILKSIDQQLMAKGYTKSENPDFMVNIFTKEKEKIDVYNSNYFGYGGWYGWNPYWWGPNFGTTTVNQYTEGTMFVDFIDFKKKEMFWQGIASANISSQLGSQKTKKINEMVGKMLEQYPDQGMKLVTK